MKELYLVTVFGDSKSCFEQYYSEEEVKAIESFFDDMSKYGVPSYDIPYVEFENRCSNGDSAV